jgi:GWxTD domain-containing protein
LESARKSVQRGLELPAEGGTLAAAYRAFRAPESGKPEEVGEDWVEGPVRALLTPAERNEFVRRFDAVSRAEFVTAFWKARDPRPETPENEFQNEFSKRAAFADSHFTQDEARGSLTDRGMVFLLFGPPSHSGRKPLQTGDDVADSSGLSQYGRAEISAAARSGGSSIDRMARIDKVEGPGVKIQEGASNWIEVWHYLRRDLPAEIPYQELEFQFMTKLGYGKNVLQRDVKPLSALERARMLARAGRVGRNASS